jgi:glycosyltransferase involved in cell wall biosynthesis
MAVVNAARSVMHLVESSGGGTVMYGKERVIHSLMRAQRERGAIAPRLAVLSACVLADVAIEEGYDVDILGARERTLPFDALGALARAIRRADRPLLHTHGYKANIIGRIMRVTGARISGLVSTCHGFIDHSPKLRMYNRIDRATSGLSDAVTAPDPRMLLGFPRSARTKFVPNAIADAPPTDAAARARARASFGWSDAVFVVGMLGRFSTEKGATIFLEAAMRCDDRSILWAAAGSGPLESVLRASAAPNLKLMGFLSPPDDFLAAIDVYVQPSLTEGLSLSLLEAMRAGLPIVATEVGATSVAVKDGRDALLVAPDPGEIATAVARLHGDAALRSALGASARGRFYDGYRMEVIERTYAEVYARAAGAGA